MVSDGDTIKIMDDNDDSTVDYEENVNVNKRLTFERYDSDATCPWVKAASTDDHVFEITVNAVNISGLKVTGATGNSKAGIYLYSSNYCNIFDNNATGNWHGIYLNDWCDYNEITNNKANSNIQFGIFLHWESTYNNLFNNTANSNNWHGIRLKEYSNHNTLTNNTANGNTKKGIFLYDSCKHNRIADNTANGNTEEGIFLEKSCQYNNLSDNNAYNNSYGIKLNKSSSNTLTNNTANSNIETGIYLNSSSNNAITCNWLAFNGYNGFLLNGESTGNNITLNNIFTNGNYDFRNDQTADVVATSNYWGTNDDDTINASIYDWQDNHDKGNVTFLPKLEGAASCAPVPDVSALILFASGLVLAAVCFGYGRREEE